MEEYNNLSYDNNSINNNNKIYHYLLQQLRKNKYN